MATMASTSLVERQVEGLNNGSLDDVTGIYADDATFNLVSAHTLPGSELRLEGKEKIERHFKRVLDGGIERVTIDWLAAGDGFLVWRDSGTFGKGTQFSEAHTARLNDDGKVVEHWIHSVYARGQ